MTSDLTATTDLVRFALRRDRVKLPIWIVAIGLGMLYAVSALPTVYATQAERQVRAELMKSPAATMMSGPGYGLDNYTLGAMITNEMVLWLAVPAAMMSIFLVVRPTRAEEETGRAELIRSAVVGRYAAPVSTLIVASLANVGVAVLTALAMISGGLDATDSVARGHRSRTDGVGFRRCRDGHRAAHRTRQIGIQRRDGGARCGVPGPGCRRCGAGGRTPQRRCRRRSASPYGSSVPRSSAGPSVSSCSRPRPDP